MTNHTTLHRDRRSTRHAARRSTPGDQGHRPRDLPPNHHADHPPMTGIWGVVAAASMVRGRDLEARLAADLAEVAVGDAVVDIGCGPGAAAREAGRRGATVVGVDPSATMRRTARVLTRGGNPGIRYVDGAAEQLPLADAAATVAWSIACVHHWRDIEAGLAEVRRVLRPGGRFVAIERSVDDDARGLASHGWIEAQAHAFAEACERAGFEGVVVERHPGSRGEVLVVRAVRAG